MDQAEIDARRLLHDPAFRRTVENLRGDLVHLLCGCPATSTQRLTMLKAELEALEDIVARVENAAGLKLVQLPEEAML